MDEVLFVGFVINLPGPDTNAWGEKVSPTPRSISPCYGTLVPAPWCLDWQSWPPPEQTLEQRAAALGIRDASRLAAITNAAMRNGTLHEQTFCQNADTIRELLDLMPKARPFVCGVGIHADDLATLTSVYRGESAPEPHLQALLQTRPVLPPSCKWIGYELLVADEWSMNEHLWLCNGIDSVARERGYAFASDALLVSYADAQTVARGMNDGSIPAEPGLWLPWRIADCASLFGT